MEVVWIRNRFVRYRTTSLVQYGSYVQFLGTPHVSEETTAAAASVVFASASAVVVLESMLSSKLSTHPAASAAHVVLLVVVIVVGMIIVVIARAVSSAAHDPVEIAGPAGASATRPGLLKVNDPVPFVQIVIHPTAKVLESPAFVADVGLELAAAVSPAAALARAAHDLGGSSKAIVVTKVALAVPGVYFLVISQETASPHSVADATATPAFKATFFVETAIAVPASHHAVPHALAGAAKWAAGSHLHVLDFVHSRIKASVPSSGAINVISVLAVDRVLHRSAVLGEVHPSLVTIVPPLGVFARAVLEVPPAVVVILSASAAGPTPLFGPDGVFAPCHAQACSKHCLWWGRQKGIGGG